MAACQCHVQHDISLANIGSGFGKREKYMRLYEPKKNKIKIQNVKETRKFETKTKKNTKNLESITCSLHNMIMYHALCKS